MVREETGEQGKRERGTGERKKENEQGREERERGSREEERRGETNVLL